LWQTIIFAEFTTVGKLRLWLELPHLVSPSKSGVLEREAGAGKLRNPKRFPKAAFVPPSFSPAR
jgi:hypothetical protein